MSMVQRICFVLALAAGLGARPLAAEEMKYGVVVESIAKGSEAMNAGVQEGDVLLDWARGDAKGVIGSPFDLFQTEVEQSPRGSVTLEGWRNKQRQSWKLGANPWGMKVRPELPENLLGFYRDANVLARGGKPAEAAERLRAAALQARSLSSQWLAPWLFLQVAEALGKTQQWKQSDENYRLAMEAAENAGPEVLGQLSRAWGFAYQQRSDWANAEKYYERFQEQNQRMGAETLLVAKSLNDLGAVAWFRGDASAAEGYFRKALAIHLRLAPKGLGVAGLLGNLGSVALNRGDLNKAQEYYLQNLDVQKRLAPDSLSLALVLNNLGVVALEQGDLQKAEEFQSQSLAVREKLAPESIDVAMSLGNLGNLVRERGDLVRADEYLHRALMIHEKLLPDSLSVAADFDALALVAAERGDLVKADELARRALTIQERLAPNTLDAADSLANLGDFAATRGDLATAEEYFHKALVIAQRVAPDKLVVATLLNNIAGIDQERGQWTSAEDHYREALAIREKLAPGSLDLAMTLNDLGELLRSRGSPSSAEEYFLRAVAIAHKQASQGMVLAQSLHHLGEVEGDRNHLDRAEEYYRKSVAVEEQLVSGNQFHAESLAALASIMDRKGELAAAAKLFEQSLDALENQTAQLGGAEEVRSTFRAKHAGYYTEYVHLLLAQKKPEEAFQVLERSRAQTLREMLAAAQMDIRKGVDPHLLDQEQSLRRLLAIKADRQMRLLNGDHSAQQVEAMKKEIEGLVNQYREVEGQIRATSPSYPGLTQPKPLSVREIQQGLLDADTLLLEYALGDQGSYLWAVTSSSFSSYALPKAEEIENTARHLYQLLTSRNRSVDGETEAQRRARWSREETDYAQTASRLSQMLLGPVSAQLERKRLVVVTEGALQYIPFAVLPTPPLPHSGEKHVSERKDPSAPLRRLVLDHEVVSLPSASALATLRRQVAGRQPAPRSVAMLADPVFDAADDRLRAEKTQGPGVAEKLDPPRLAAPSGLVRSANEVGASRDGIFPRLPFTRREAEAIYSIAPEDAFRAIDFAASKQTATSSQLKNYRILHFATHGLLNNEHPELSGLVFSLVDPQGKTQDGFLRLIDIYNLDLNAELVVLSACQTALGKQTKGEGLQGLTRGFMYAGASRVVASLWNVDDEATAELMKRFYENMLQNGQSPAQALRRAQLWMQAQRPWRSPYYWGGFVLQGEWR